MKINISNQEIYVWLSDGLFSDLKEKIERELKRLQ